MLHFNRGTIKNIPEFNSFLSYIGFQDQSQTNYYITSRCFLGFSITCNELTVVVDEKCSFTIIFADLESLENATKKLSN